MANAWGSSWGTYTWGAAWGLDAVSGSRALDVSTLIAVRSPQLSPVALVELEFGSGTVRMWSGYGVITTPDGREWHGAGNLGTIGAIEDTAESRATATVLELSGVGEPIATADGETVDVLAIAHGETWQQRPGRVYFGVLDDNLRWIGDIVPLREGIMDRMELSEGSGANVRLTIESELIDNERPEAQRFTAENQRARYADDAFCDQIAALQDKSITWFIGT